MYGILRSPRHRLYRGRPQSSILSPHTSRPTNRIHVNTIPYGSFGFCSVEFNSVHRHAILRLVINHFGLFPSVAPFSYSSAIRRRLWCANVEKSVHVLSWRDVCVCVFIVITVVHTHTHPSSLSYRAINEEYYKSNMRVRVVKVVAYYCNNYCSARP